MYADAANTADVRPPIYGITSTLKVGFIINKAPVNAIIIDIIWFLFIVYYGVLLKMFIKKLKC